MKLRFDMRNTLCLCRLLKRNDLKVKIDLRGPLALHYADGMLDFLGAQWS